jgi:hypothetical protein
LFRAAVYGARRADRRHPVEEPLVLVGDEAGVRTLTLNRPKSLN